MKRAALSAALAVLGLVGAVGCRDWDRFEPVTGGGAPVGGSNSGAGNVGAGDLGGGPQGAGDQGGGPIGGSPMGGSPTGGGGPTGCGQIDILSDDFDAPLDWRWSGSTGAVSVSGGELVIPHAAGYVQIETSAGFDFRGRNMVLELAAPPGPGSSLWWDVAGDPSNYLEFYIDGNETLYFGYEKDGGFFDIASRPFDAVEHRFQRFREEDGTAFYDVSADGTAWEEITSWQLDAVFDPAFTSVYIGGNSDIADGDTHIARIYAEDPVPSAPCPTATLVDDFDDNQRSSAWYHGWDEPECPIQEVSGELRISCEPGLGTDSAYVSSAAYDLTGSQVSVEIIDYPSAGSGGYMAIALVRPYFGDEYLFVINDGELQITRTINGSGTELTSASYDGDAARFLRIREAAGIIFFEISADGSTFTSFYNEATSIDVGELWVVLFAGMYMANAPVDVAFDNLNVGP